MKRRGFIQLSSTISALAASGKLPLLLAGQSRALPEIEPVSTAVREFFPTFGTSFDPLGSRETVYKLVRWHYLEKGAVHNIDTGTLRIKRSGASQKAHYWVEKQISLPNRQDAFWSATLETEGPLDLPRSWSVKCRHTDPGSGVVQPGSQVTVQGEFQNGKIRLSDGSFTATHAFRDPLVTQWAIPSILAQGGIKTKPFSFCMLDEALKFKPDQTLRYCGTAPIPTAQGEIPLDAYLQTGTGVLPAHWLVDSQGRTQVMTHAIMNWMLKGIA